VRKTYTSRRNTRQRRHPAAAAAALSVCGRAVFAQGESMRRTATGFFAAFAGLPAPEAAPPLAPPVDWRTRFVVDSCGTRGVVATRV